MKRPVVLVEPATEHAGHWQEALVRLAAAAAAEDRQAVVVTLNGIPAHLHRSLQGHRVLVLTRPHGPTGRLFLALAKRTHRASSIARRLLPHRRSPHQITLIARCLTEAASLCTARHTLSREPESVVILTASEALHAMARLLSQTSHVRVVHEVNTTEDRPLRAVGRLAPTRRVAAVCPTAAVGNQIRALFPNLVTTVHPFALAETDERITADERPQARRDLGLPDNTPVLCVVGGWWPHKDMATLASALEHLTRPLHVLVAGEPTQPGLLRRIAAAPQVTLRHLTGPLAPADIRRVYAAADFTTVLRHPGVDKESGLVADCARLGVPLLVSDHDPDLTRRVSTWATVLPARNPSALAATIDHAATHPLPPPPHTATKDLALHTPHQALALFKELMP
ncbi:hypothetical protein [Nocardiopsis sp. CNT312]|uniref:hypothetical protein n=1 Tax=Nocardiopsis sp. CNT312 TaxID=1137268 RepID=UPI000490AB4F|nr:hypothetical protein [Nocardiopsis sp. CNT312]